MTYADHIDKNLDQIDNPDLIKISFRYLYKNSRTISGKVHYPKKRFIFA